MSVETLSISIKLTAVIASILFGVCGSLMAIIVALLAYIGKQVISRLDQISGELQRIEAKFDTKIEDQGRDLSKIINDHEARLSVLESAPRAKSREL